VKRLDRMVRSLFSKDSGLPIRDCRNGGNLSGEEGSEIVEFALSAVLLFAFLFGVTAFCVMLFMRSTAAEAARETSRWASVRGTDCNNPQITDGTCPASLAQVAAYGQSLPGAAGMTVTVQYFTPAGASAGTTNQGEGGAVKVTVAYTFASVPLMPKSNALSFSKTSAITLSSTSQSVIW